MPALPPVPNVFRADIHMQNNIGQKFSLRSFFSFSGGTPGPATCTTFGTAWGNAWITDVMPLVSNGFSITGVTVTDLTSPTSATGSVTLTGNGTRGVSGLPMDVCTLINHHIARRYRGGKPRTYLPGPVSADLADVSHYTAAFVSAATSGYSNWITACVAATAGPIIIGNHVSVSYYSGFKPFTTPSGRVKNISQVRTPPIPVDTIGSSTANTIPGSQRRRYQR